MNEPLEAMTSLSREPWRGLAGVRLRCWQGPPCATRVRARASPVTLAMLDSRTHLSNGTLSFPRVQRCQDLMPRYGGILLSRRARSSTTFATLDERRPGLDDGGTKESL
jgi:hypothetical protein